MLGFEKMKKCKRFFEKTRKKFVLFEKRRCFFNKKGLKRDICFKKILAGDNLFHFVSL